MAKKKTYNIKRIRLINYRSLSVIGAALIGIGAIVELVQYYQRIKAKKDKDSEI